MSEDRNGTQGQGAQSGTEHTQQWPPGQDGVREPAAGGDAAPGQGAAGTAEFPAAATASPGMPPLSMDSPAPGAAGGGSPAPGPGEPGTPGEPGHPGAGEIPAGSYGRPAGYGQPGGYGTGGYGIPPGGYGGYGPWGGPPGGYGRPPRRRKRFLAFAAVAILAAGIGAGTAMALGGGNTSSTGVSSNEVPSPHKNAAATGSGGLNQQAVFNKVEPGVVDITSQLTYQSATAQGTGMVINSAGLVLTNNHVIDQATSIKATSVTTGKTYTARVVGYDASQDVALLQLQGASGLPTVKVGNSSQVTLGTPVLAIGNAEGQGGSSTVAQGVINAENRTITASDQGGGMSETLHGMLQTNAQIEPGDSGGPLANAAGQVIGMDTAASSSVQGSTVYGYAIPINEALSIAKQIAAGKSSSTVHIGLTGFMGVSVAPSSAQGCPASGGGPGGSGFPGSGFGTGSGGSVTPGALVCGTLPGTPAASSGLTAGDVITAVDGRTVSSSNALTSIMGNYKPGKKVSIPYVTPPAARKPRRSRWPGCPSKAGTTATGA